MQYVVRTVHCRVYEKIKLLNESIKSRMMDNGHALQTEQSGFLKLGWAVQMGYVMKKNQFIKILFNI